MSAELYRKNRKKWGYRFYLRGKCSSRYAWDTKTQAKQAEQEAQVEARKNPALQPTALATASGAYLIASAERGRSRWRIDGLNYTFKAHIIPHFGETTPITDINPGMVKNFITTLKQKGLKNKSVKNIIADLRALYNWAMESKKRTAQSFLQIKILGQRVAELGGVKCTTKLNQPVDSKLADIAASVIENKQDRAWFDVTRFTGMRKDESNRLQWSDINWRSSEVRIPGTKTDEAEAWLPIAPTALTTLRDLHESPDRDPNYVFPGRSAQTKGKRYTAGVKCLKIQQVTAVKEFLRQHPSEP